MITTTKDQRKALKRIYLRRLGDTNLANGGPMGTDPTDAQQEAATRVAAVLEGNYVVDNMAAQRREYWRDGKIVMTLTAIACHPTHPFGSFTTKYPLMPLTNWP